jgi:diaminohydroxyphosphoribosylaminopyrimidine deaminase/5-amino-6-(5-phosphoribosylamino)uracil reductase
VVVDYAMLSLTPIANTFSFSSIICKCKASLDNHSHALDAGYIRRAAHLADKSAGFTSPHPNFGCVIATPSGHVAGEGYLYAQGTSAAEVQAVTSAGELSRGATAYLNMEPGDCDGDNTAVSALLQVCSYSSLFFSKFVYQCM